MSRLSCDVVDILEVVGESWRSLPCIDAVSSVRVAVKDEHELVLAGVARLLSQFPHRMQLIGWDEVGAAQVVLYGVQEEVRSHDALLHSLLRSSTATILVFGWRPDAPQVLLALACGVTASCPRNLPAAQLVERIEHLHGTRDPDVLLPAGGE